MRAEKKIVSQFEFAITEICDPKAAEKMRPRTDGEEIKHRRENIKRQLDRLGINENDLNPPIL